MPHGPKKKKKRSLKKHLKANNNKKNLRKRGLTVDPTTLPTLLYYESALGLSQSGFRSGEWEEPPARWEPEPQPWSLRHLQAQGSALGRQALVFTE